MLKASVTVDNCYTVSTIDKRLFSSFVEVVGRSVYDGIFCPGSPLSDEHGFRKDIIEIIKAASPASIRYPGGNYASDWDWEKCVGPADQRKIKLDLAWKRRDTNTFGLNEFIEWAKLVNSEPMICLNLGSRGMQEARNLIEYCNFKGGSYYSDLRRSHGYEEPHKIKLWCLGNEMDGSWQIGHKTAYEYGRLANETAAVMRTIDPDVELVLCGSSSNIIDTYGDWDAEVLDLAYQNVDYLSLHTYFDNYADNTPDFLANSLNMDQHIKTVVAVCDYVKGKKRSKKQINLSFDEYNILYHSRLPGMPKPTPWEEKPHVIEEIYNMEDALLIGSMLITLLKHADRVKISCLSQLVNAFAPIMCSEKSAWCQPTYYPFMHVSNNAKGTVLNTLCDSPKYDGTKYKDVPYLDTVATFNEEEETLVFFMVNKALDDSMEVECDLRQFSDYKVAEFVTMNHNDIKAINTEDAPFNVAPVASTSFELDSGKLKVVLKEHSWNMIKLSKQKAE